MKVKMINTFGKKKTVRTGYCLPMLLAGCFVPASRGDVKWTSISVIGSILTCGLCWLILPFIYNRIYISGLIRKGWLPADRKNASVLDDEGIRYPRTADKGTKKR